MSRLHLGGGTPTLLSVPLLDKLLDGIHSHFSATQDFEFSVEIDPTEAETSLVDRLLHWGMTRASIGIQDFSLPVQRAIGREQSLLETQRVVQQLRAGGLQNLNFDLLCGLPLQTTESLDRTLAEVKKMDPERIALYGYVHVPHLAKRQVMISTADLPNSKARFQLRCLANERLTDCGFEAIGIDHFAKPFDSLTHARNQGTLRRDLQGYNDDPTPTLVGFGASAISRFSEGYVQNSIATAVYRARIADSGLAGQRGYALAPIDRGIAKLIEDLICRFECNLDNVARDARCNLDLLIARRRELSRRFPEAVVCDGNRMSIKAGYRPLTRIIAGHARLSPETRGVFATAVQPCENQPVF